MLNTMSSAHNKIFGAKFLSFERFELMRLYTMDYAFFLTKTYEIRLAKEPFFSAIEPLLHYDTATIVIQKSHFYTLIVALSECKSGSIVWRGCCLRSKTPKKQLFDSLESIFIL